MRGVGCRSATERNRAATILEEWGGTAHSRIARLPNYDYLLTGGGRGVVPFVISGGTALALGAPVGPSSLIPEAVRQFLDYCQDERLSPVFVPVRPEDLGPMLAAGLRVLRIGEEARLSLRDFDMRGGRFKSVRQSVNRSVREGLRFRMLEPPVAPDALRELRAVSERWLVARGRAERTFGLGWFEPDYLSRFRIATLTGPEGKILAFANLLDGYGPEEGSVDLTRYHPDAPPGAMDTLFARVATLYRSEGKAFFNLGLAPLAGVARIPNPGLLERGLALVYRVGGAGYSFYGVREFKNKFRPRWELRYLCYPSLRALPRTLFAAAELRRPGLLRRGSRNPRSSARGE